MKQINETGNQKSKTMKMINAVGFGVMAILTVSFTTHDTNIKDGEYLISTLSSEVIWNGKKVTGQHFGTVSVKRGLLEISEGNLVGGSFEIDMTSISNTDLEGDYAIKLENHLKSDDFFGVATYPTAKFKITNVVSKGTPGAYKITGDLTIKSTTKRIKFDALVTSEGSGIATTADIVIDRSEFDVRFGSGSFFDNLGDKTIYDDFTLSVKLIAE